MTSPPTGPTVPDGARPGPGVPPSYVAPTAPAAPPGPPSSEDPAVPPGPPPGEDHAVPPGPPPGEDHAVSAGHRALVAIGLVALAVVAAVAAYAVYRVFVTTHAGQHLDDAAFRGAEIGRHYVVDVALKVLDVVSVLFLVLAVAVVGIIAIGRRRYGLGVAAVVLVAGANLTTQLLKYGVFDRPDFDIGPSHSNSLPSGHTTVAASVAVALILIVPRKFRVPTTVLAGGYATLTGISTLVAGWHRPSDVVAALLVVAAWTALVAAFAQFRQPALRGPDAPEAPPTSRAPAPSQPGGPGIVLRVKWAAAPAPFRPGGLSPASRAFVWALVALALIGAGVTVVVFEDIRFGAVALQTRGDLLMAYGGGSVGIASAACLVFALALALSPVAGRTRVRQRDRPRGHVS